MCCLMVRWPGEGSHAPASASASAMTFPSSEQFCYSDSCPGYIQTGLLQLLRLEMVAAFDDDSEITTVQNAVACVLLGKPEVACG